MLLVFINCPAVELTVHADSRGTKEEVNLSLSSYDPGPAVRGVGMLVFEMDNLSCAD